MSLKKYSREELERKPMIELAHLILTDKKKAQDFYEVYDEVAKLKGFTEKQKSDNIAQFHTNLTVDGRFMALHTSSWGLKRWYIVEETDEEVAAAPKKKKKTKAKPKPKKKKAKTEEPKEEEEKDIPADDIEVLTGDFKEAGDDDEDSDDLFDESFDDESDDEFDDDEFDEDDDEFDDDEEDKDDKK
ncbi:DNA-directed RNA polymerase subunit delta [Virgibacillus sp. JSM 102003]|uniref:DNA-directed RNA polymerase subunit delta n=1 Tax=Virgibacillus sp. JSM 102003 TaxID=1562108 RepID=UPI0035BECEB3